MIKGMVALAALACSGQAVDTSKTIFAVNSGEQREGGGEEERERRVATRFI